MLWQQLHGLGRVSEHPQEKEVENGGLECTASYLIAQINRKAWISTQTFLQSNCMLFICLFLFLDLNFQNCLKNDPDFTERKEGHPASSTFSQASG